MGRFDWLEIGKKGPAAEATEEKKEDIIYDINYFMQSAEKSFCTGAYEAALRQYAKALGENPNLSEAWLGQVNCLIELNELKEARIWMNKAIEKFPNSAELISAKAVILAKMFEYEEALNLSDKAIARKEPDKQVWINRGFILLYKDENNAKYCFSKALEGNLLDPKLNLRIGACFAELGKFSDAKYYFDKALNLAPDNPLVWHKLGYCSENLGLVSRALYCYEKCLSFKPEFKNTVIKDIERLSKRGIFKKLFSIFFRLWRQ